MGSIDLENVCLLDIYVSLLVVRFLEYRWRHQCQNDAGRISIPGVPYLLGTLMGVPISYVDFNKGREAKESLILRKANGPCHLFDFPM